MENQNMGQQQEQQSQSEPEQNINENGSGNKDIEDNKPLAIIGYIIPILFFVPLLTDAKNSKFAKFHANQQLNLLLTGIAVKIIGTIIPFLGWFIILPFGSIFVIILVILGIINAAKGIEKPLPLVGGFNLIS